MPHAQPGGPGDRAVQTAFIEKGRPQQNAFAERFNGSMRDELLNGEEFDSLLEARVVIGTCSGQATPVTQSFGQTRDRVVRDLSPDMRPGERSLATLPKIG